MKKATQKKLLIASLALFVVLTSIIIFRSSQIVAETGAVDFRNRVVGTRQALEGYNPYLFKWRLGTSERLLDPADGIHNNDHKYTRFTSAPSTLLLLAPVAGVDFKILKWINFGVMWLGFFFLVWVGYYLSRDTVARAVTIFYFSGVVTSHYWMMHLERGQQYIFFASLLAGAVVLDQLGKDYKWVAPLQTLTIFFRPAFAPIGLAQIPGKRRFQQVGLMAACFLIFMLILNLFFPLSYWQNYFEAGKDWFYIMFGAHTKLGSGLPVYPPAPEGDPTLWVYRNFPVPPGFVHSVLFRVLGVASRYEMRLLIMAVAVVAFIIRHRNFLRGRSPTNQEFLLQVLALVVILDQFLPAPRSGYNNVLAWSYFPVLTHRFARPKWAAVILILTGLLSLPAQRNENYFAVAPEAIIFFFSIYACFAQPIRGRK